MTKHINIVYSGDNTVGSYDKAYQHGMTRITKRYDQLYQKNFTYKFGQNDAISLSLIMLNNKIQAVEQALSNVATIGSGYIDKVNTFPSVAILRPSIARKHVGDASIISTYVFTVRGYVQTDEDSINSSEQLARSIEHTIQNMNKDAFYSIRVTSVDTDEGLLSPYGVCDITCEASWFDE